MTIQALQDELRTQRDLNHLLQQESGNRGAEHFTIELTEENFRRLQAEHDRQAKELFLLRKTLEEMELRIETQKQTLNARDESIKKLLEMLQSKGLPSKSLEDDSERTRRMAEAESQVSHLEVILDQKEKENIHLREVRASVSPPPLPPPPRHQSLIFGAKSVVKLFHQLENAGSLNLVPLSSAPYSALPMAGKVELGVHFLLHSSHASGCQSSLCSTQ